MISFSSSGELKRTQKFLTTLSKGNFYQALSRQGQMGVAALSAATPKESGRTAGMWTYTVSTGRGGAKITWSNGHVEDGVPIAIILQYGHGTRNGGYVAGRNYINPAMKPVFDKIAEDVWKVVTSA